MDFGLVAGLQGNEYRLLGIVVLGSAVCCVVMLCTDVRIGNRVLEKSLPEWLWNVNTLVLCDS
jgi:hypothetical protein